MVLDVGASVGAFAVGLRAAGYHGRIVSIEPLSTSFTQLAIACESDPQWECLHLALGSHPGAATLNVSRNAASSSLLPMEERLSIIEPRAKFGGTERCTVATLDELRERVLRDGDRAYLKLDVQGAELEVLRGSEAALKQCEIIQAELSVVPLYTGAPLLQDVVLHLDDRGFGLLAIESAWADPRTGLILQVDGIFARSDPSIGRVDRSLAQARQ